MQKLLLFVLTALVCTLNAQAQDCPRIFTKGDTLYTDPAPKYQWFRGNDPINGATNQWYLPAKGGNFSVQISGTTTAFSYTLPSLAKTITGRIVDERYEPIADALVSIGVKNVKSDAQGRFSLTGLEKGMTLAVVTITKAGFWKNTQRLHFFDQDTAALTAMLEPLKVTNRFDAQKGATISERGFYLTFPPNSAVTEDGKTYTGTINISLKRSFPSEDGFGLRMPGGDFSAIDQNGQEKMLISYGFMSAEMQGANGEKLKLASDKEATLEFYIPWEDNKTAPDSMPLWHFDETKAVWKPEGIARKVGPRYVGTVKHFSSWNCDVPGEFATVRGKVVDCKGNPIPNNLVTAGQITVTTNSRGMFECFVASGIPFYLTAGVDTVFLNPLDNGTVKDVGTLTSNHIVGAIGWIDSTGAMTVFGYNVKEYSVDSGKTFYPKGEKLMFKEKYPRTGIAKDSFGCAVNFRIIILPKTGDCQRMDVSLLDLIKMALRIEEALNHTQAVHALQISNDSIYGIPFIAQAFPCLHYLQYSNSPDNQFPESIGHLSNLQVLYFMFNKITAVPPSITQLTHLRNLSLASNQLATFPEIVLQLNQLIELDLSSNPLGVIPESIGQLTNLQILSLGNSRLRNIPASIGQLTNLRVLALESNALTSLPPSIANLKDNLKSLMLNGNTDIPEEEKAKIRSWLPNTTITF